MPHLRRLTALLAALTLAVVPAACGDDNDTGDFPSNEGQETAPGGGSETRPADPGPEAEPTGTQPGLTQETTP
jgi:hypothetical protein